MCVSCAAALIDNNNNKSDKKQNRECTREQSSVKITLPPSPLHLHQKIKKIRKK